MEVIRRVLGVPRVADEADHVSHLHTPTVEGER